VSAGFGPKFGPKVLGKKKPKSKDICTTRKKEKGKWREKEKGGKQQTELASGLAAEGPIDMRLAWLESGDIHWARGVERWNAANVGWQIANHDNDT
jgi:hypothetical protein